ncbi:hypothetical protein CWE09_02270 [Aliidiomarina minuta]|uniref:DUF2383 domain-containing protein n=1 Tax=Aliidiomarina minuta TaxID=880057 RepID=A0A432W6H0_9GAMM|nr:hypothetical protein [Aliidiomarina minuta]RUO25579.1 hypothetical protein CWE09_02270 [Aliidiomarina minuta]
MELSNPINNQHMIDGLNEVLVASFNAQHHCGAVLKKSSDKKVRRVIKELINAHDNHIELLSDAIRYLGGAPRTVSDLLPFGKLKTIFFPYRNLRQQEENLIELCNQKIKYLAGSSEATIKLNLVKDDIAACLYMTEAVKD